MQDPKPIAILSLTNLAGICRPCDGSENAMRIRDPSSYQCSCCLDVPLHSK